MTKKKWIILYTHELRLYLKDRVEFEKEYRQTFYTKDGKHKPIWKNSELHCQTYNNLLKKHNLIISENFYTAEMTNLLATAELTYLNYEMR